MNKNLNQTTETTARALLFTEMNPYMMRVLIHLQKLDKLKLDSNELTDNSLAIVSIWYDLFI